MRLPRYGAVLYTIHGDDEDGDTKKIVCDLQFDAIDVYMHACMHARDGRKGRGGRKKERRKMRYTVPYSTLYEKCAVVTVHVCVCVGRYVCRSQG